MGTNTFDMARLIAQLIHHEGERLQHYRDSVGKVTIGVGRNLTDVGIRPHEVQSLGLTNETAIAKGINRNQSRQMLMSDIGHVLSQLDAALNWWRGLDPVRQRVLIDMGFNMGITTLKGFKTTLKLIKQGKWQEAADAMLRSKWAKQVGQRAIRLAQMMRTGREPADIPSPSLNG